MESRGREPRVAQNERRPRAATWTSGTPPHSPEPTPFACGRCRRLSPALRVEDPRQGLLSSPTTQS
eukprot:scaffold978_cov392-Prasinococcus_capsulatus_cf.AAC.25